MSKRRTKTIFCGILYLILISHITLNAQETTLQQGSSNMLSDARVAGTGIYNLNVDGTDLLIIGNTISAIGDDTVTVKQGTLDITLTVTSNTVVCKMDEAISLSKLNIGDQVVITAASRGTDAISIKVGQLLLAGLFSGLKPVDYDCGTLEPIAWWQFWK